MYWAVKWEKLQRMSAVKKKLRFKASEFLNDTGHASRRSAYLQNIGTGGLT
jgi:hypothetical protein